MIIFVIGAWHLLKPDLFLWLHNFLYSPLKVVPVISFLLDIFREKFAKPPRPTDKNSRKFPQEKVLVVSFNFPKRKHADY